MTPDARTRAEKIVEYYVSDEHDKQTFLIDIKDAIEEAEREAVISAQMEWEGVRGPTLMGLAFEKGFHAAREKAAEIVKEFGMTRKNHGGTEWDYAMKVWSNEIFDSIRQLEPEGK